MKTILLSFILFHTICVLDAQNISSRITVKGTVIDSLKGTPISFSTISLLDKKSNKLIKNTLSKENGSFEFNDLLGKPYLLEIVSVGYQQKTTVINYNSLSESSVIDAGKIPIAPSAKGIGEVVVTGIVKKPLIKQEVDRISYDVQADPANNGMNVLDMLRKVPLVSVDATDKIMLKGSGNYKILINGQPSALIAQNPSDVFKAMPASNIIKIEVITTPPAKYDAEGLAGIINIITKKNIGDGYNGNISSSYNTINGARFNFNGTVKQGKLGASGYIGLQIPNQQVLDNGYTNNIKSPSISYLSQKGTNREKSRNPYLNLEVSYEFDSLHLLSANVSNYQWISKQSNTQTSTVEDVNQTLLQAYGLDNSSHLKYFGTDAAINYQLGFKNNKERLLTASYKYNSQGYTSDINGLYSNQLNTAFPNYKQYNDEGTKEHTLQLDYVHPVNKLTIEAGAKAIFRNNFSNYNFGAFDNNSSQYVTDTAQTNDFKSNQNVYSLYNSYELKLEQYVVKAGLRLEQTTVDAQFSSVGASANQDYYNLIPSISMQRKFKTSSSINLGYTERIQRPSIWQLNPFVNKSNPLVISSGNPDLQTVVSHSIELNYSYFAKGNINIGLSYSFANNTVENVTSVNKDTVTETNYMNVGKNRSLGLNVNGNYPITKQLNFNINAQLMHVWLKGTFNGEFYDQAGFQGHCFTTTSYNLPKDYHISADIGYDSRYVMLQGRDNFYYYFSLGGSKDLFNKKASISVVATNPFNQFRKIDFYTSTSSFSQYNYNFDFARRFNITFRYKFGHLNSDIKKSERAISNDDTGGRGGR